MRTTAIREALKALRDALEDHPNTSAACWEVYVRARDEVDAIEATSTPMHARQVAREEAMLQAADARESAPLTCDGCTGRSYLHDAAFHVTSGMANVPSGKAMLCDGPLPTEKQVAHIRDAALEEAAGVLESCSAHSYGRIVRALKTPQPMSDREYTTEVARGRGAPPSAHVKGCCLLGSHDAPAMCMTRPCIVPGCGVTIEHDASHVHTKAMPGTEPR